MEGWRGVGVRRVRRARLPSTCCPTSAPAGADSQPARDRRDRSRDGMSAHKDKKKEYLTIKDLQKVLDSCKLNLNEVDEVWPKIYIGNV